MAALSVISAFSHAETDVEREAAISDGQQTMRQ